MKGTEILHAGAPGSGEWDRLMETSGYATYFHSPEWAHIWSEYSDGKIVPAPVLLTFAGGARVLLPFSLEKACKGCIRTALSSPAETYGGWLSGDRIGAEHAGSIREYIRREYPNHVMRANPYNPDMRPFHETVSADDTTLRVRLDMPFERLEKGWREAHRRAVRKAVRAGVTVREASSRADWDGYYDVYRDSLRRWGTGAGTRYGPELFEIMRSLRSPRIRLWLAEYRGDIAAGALCLCSRHCEVYWHGAAREDCFSVEPAKYLFYEILRDACARGYQWFDFNPSGGHDGVRQFKQGFRPETVRCPVFVSETPAKKLYRALVSAAGRKKP